MAVLEKIRVKLGVLITVLIAVALLSFIIDPSTLETTVSYFSSKYDVGKIDGKKIRYQEFQNEVDYLTNIYTMTSGQQSLSQEAMEAVNETAWQNTVNKTFIVPQIQKAGINVSDDEVVDLSYGIEISPVLANDPAFIDPATGQFSREQLMDFIHAIPADATGNLAAYWDFLRNNVINTQYFTKYSSIISNSDILTPIELRRMIEENNTTSDVEFVLVPFGFGRDTTLKVSDSEIRKYYEAHKKNYKQVASRDVEFVAYEVVPSEADIKATEEEMNELFAEFKEATNLKTFLSFNSDTPLANYYYKKGELSSLKEIDEFAFGKNPTVLPVFQKENTFYAARVNDTKTMPDSVFVRHILLSAADGMRADSLVNVVKKGGNFSALASQFSLDKNPNVENPGDLGWMTQTAMIPGMEGVLDMKAGEVKTMSTQYGIHVVNVTKATKPMKKVQIAILSREVLPSEATNQYYYGLANDLAARAEGDIEKFNAITAEEDLAVVPANSVLESAKRLSRYEDVKEVIRWIYDDKTKEGDVSPIITVNNQIHFVVAVKNIKEEGFTPVETVAKSIEFTLMNQKRNEKKVAEVAAKIEGLTDMNAIAEALGQTISTKNDVSFGAMTTRATEPAFVGAVAGAELNQISGPVAGNMGVYVFRVLDRETGAFYTEDDAKIRAAQIESYQINNLPVIFNERGDIKDNRARFY